jgi:hypothetical protein
MFEKYLYDEKDTSGRGCDECANGMSVLQGRVIKIVHGHDIQERQHSVLTNQCLGKEMSAEPPGRGTEEPFLMDRDKFMVLWRATLFAGRGPSTRRHEQHDDSEW